MTKPTHKVELLFGDRPAVLKSIIEARRDRKLSFDEIASVLSTEPETNISGTAVKSWLKKEGVS